MPIARRGATLVNGVLGAANPAAVLLRGPGPGIDFAPDPLTKTEVCSL